jgi:DNA-binding transcriptional LysR family regulator
MNLSLRQLRAFLNVARYASFTKAAETMHITQAGLSAMIRELEEQLQCRLFERTTRTVRLTEAGLALQPAATRILQQLEDVAGTMASLDVQASKRLKVGVTPLVASSIMPEVLMQLRNEQPALHIELHDAERARIQQAVADGDLDLGLGAFFSQISGIQRELLFSGHLVLATPHSPNAPPPASRWNQLDPSDMISLPPTNPLQRLVDTRLKPTLEHIEGRTVVSHLQTILAMVEAGLGCAVVPSFAQWSNHRWRVSLTPLEPRIPLDFYWITRAGRPASESMLSFLQTFRAVAIQ